MFNAPSSPLAKIALGVACVALVIGALWAYGDAREALGASKAREKAQGAAAAQFAKEVTNMNGLGAKLVGAIEAANKLEPKVLERYKYVKQKAPLPADCRVDPDRLRSISDAVDAANAFGRRGN